MKFYTELLGLKLSYKANLEDCTLYYLKDEVTGVEIELTEKQLSHSRKNHLR